MQNQELEDYTPVMLSTQEMLSAAWPAVEPLIEKYLERHKEDDYTTKDILDMAMKGQIFLFAYKKDTVEGLDVKLVIGVQFKPDPVAPIMYLSFAAGEHLQFFFEKYWKSLCGWAYMIGARRLEAYFDPALERMLRQYGFTRMKIYVTAPLLH